MHMVHSLYYSYLRDAALVKRGKVRDIYQIDDEHLLIVTTDRLSAFDAVLPTPIPGKGKVLNELSGFWFRRLSHIVPNHLADLPVTSVLQSTHDLELAEGRAVVVRRCWPLPIEAIVRGYLAGSGWLEYQQTGSVSGVPLPAGLRDRPTRDDTRCHALPRAGSLRWAVRAPGGRVRRSDVRSPCHRRSRRPVFVARPNRP